MNSTGHSRRLRRLVRRVAVATALTAAVLAVIGGAFLAGRATTRPIDTVEPTETRVTVRVTEETLERTVPLVARYDWVESTPLLAPADGVLTASGTGAAKRIFAEGEVLARIDERPVVVVAGEVPAFRSMKRGDVGTDIHQLNDYLMRTGFLDSSGPTFTRDTERVIKNIQAWIGLDVTGVVLPGDYLFVPKTPVLVSVEIIPGTPVTAGQRFGATFAPEPRLTVQVSADQSQLIAPNTLVRVALGDGAILDASIGRTVTQADGSIEAELEPAGGRSVCGERCTDVQSGEIEAVTADVVIVPRTTGPSVPVGAIRTDEEGSTFVLLADGRKQVVQIRTSLNGAAIVSGVDVGTEVVLVGDVPPS